MSFCYINASVFGLKRSTTMLISKNQTNTDRTSLRNVFDRYFKQTTPQWLCLFAISTIAMANGFNSVLAIKHNAQIFYKIDRHVYMLKVPLKLRPIDGRKFFAAPGKAW